MFDELEKIYSDMEISKLLNWGKDLKYGATAYFAWLSAIQDFLEDNGIFETIIGNKFCGIRENRESLQEECDDLNERLNDLKNSTDHLDPTQKISYRTCYEILQNKRNYKTDS